jgi:hypothetical protein
MSKLYRIYIGMKTRCYNAKRKVYRHYGARGIVMCDEWLGRSGFAAFKVWALANGFSPNLTIDRIDVDGPYSPANCRWVPMSRQARNRRENVTVDYHGATKHLLDWIEELGLSRSHEMAYRWRLAHGWTPERTFQTPIRRVAK